MTVTLADVLETDERYLFDIVVDWQGSTGDYRLTIELAEKTFTKKLEANVAAYAQSISQNTYDEDALNSVVTFTLEKSGTPVETVTGTIDINYQQSSDLTYLYLAYTLLWGGLFAYIFYLHQQQQGLVNLVKGLNKAPDDKSTADATDESTNS